MNRSFIAIIVCLLALSCVQNKEPDHKIYTPDWESLSQYKVPEWFRDAKFGIFIHWGVYSVPAYVNEWYPRNMYRKGTSQYNYHLETYGSQKEFGYKDFIPMFKAEKWDPEAWASLFKESGARYVVPVAEHHDGFPMYDCSFTEYNAFKMGPKRDIIGELLEACRASGLKAGVSSHRAFNWEFYAQEEEFDTWDTTYSQLYWKRRTQRWPDKDFVSDWYLRTNELVSKYRPDVLWFDFYLDQPELHDVRYQLAADYFNLSEEWNKEVVLQYKYDIYHPSVGVLDIERGKLAGIRRPPWQTDTSVGYKGWCYVQDPEYKEPGLLIDDLVDIVSKNGNLLLNIGPKPDGTLPVQDRDILLEIGKWLKLNGESIYETRPWIIFGEGPSQTASGAHQERKNQGGTSKDYRFTTKGNTLYAVCLDWPEEDFTIKSLGRDSTGKFGIEIIGIELLGHTAPLKWEQSQGSLDIDNPSLRPCEHAFVFKIGTSGLDRQMSKYIDDLPVEPETIYCFPGNSLRIDDEYNVRDGRLNNLKKDAVARWNIHVKNPGLYEIRALQQNREKDRYVLAVNNSEFTNPEQSTGREFTDVLLGETLFEQEGQYELTLKAVPGMERDYRFALQQIRLVKKD